MIDLIVCPACDGKIDSDGCVFCSGGKMMLRSRAREWVLKYVVANELATLEIDQKFSDRAANGWHEAFTSRREVIAKFLFELPEELKTSIADEILVK